MPRYYFNTENGHWLRDEDGTELAHDEAARLEAVAALGELLQERCAEFWQSEYMRVIVTNADGLTLFMIDATAITTPACSTSPMQWRARNV